MRRERERVCVSFLQHHSSTRNFKNPKNTRSHTITEIVAVVGGNSSCRCFLPAKFNYNNRQGRKKQSFGREKTSVEKGKKDETMRSNPPNITFKAWGKLIDCVVAQREKKCGWRRKKNLKFSVATFYLLFKFFPTANLPLCTNSLFFPCFSVNGRKNICAEARWKISTDLSSSGKKK